MAKFCKSNIKSVSANFSALITLNSRLFRKSAAFYGTQEVHCYRHRPTALGPVLGQMKTARTPRNLLLSVLSKLQLGHSSGLILLGYTD